MSDAEAPHDVFFEVFEALPRQGPGDRKSTRRAFELCRDLPASATVLDLGCGVGAQTFDLATLTDGVISAVDNHAPFIDRLRDVSRSCGLDARIRPIVRDMGALDFAPEHFDLVWSEGALYQLGLDRALTICHRLLRDGGYLAFTDAVWRRDDPPAEVKATFDAEYPTMGRIEDVMTRLKQHGFSTIDHFTLPEDAWWDEFYAPMERRMEQLRTKYADDATALAALTQLLEETELHRKHSSFYAYEFFVAQKPSAR